MSGKINLNVGGGNINIGNIVQGDRNQSTSGDQTIRSRSDDAFAAVLKSLDARAASDSQHREEIAQLQTEITALQKRLSESDKEDDSLLDVVHAMYDKYGWAADLLRKLFAVVLPSAVL